MDAARGRPNSEEPVSEARAAVWVGIWASATRCVLTYLVLPALGALGPLPGRLLGPLGLLLQALGAITSVSGASRLRGLGVRWWWAYALVAAVVVAGTAIGAVRLVGGAAT